MMQLKRRHMNVLRMLAGDQHSFFYDFDLPDGNGRLGGPTELTLRELHIEGLIERELVAQPTVKGYRYRYRITVDGFNAIDELSVNGAPES